MVDFRKINNYRETAQSVLNNISSYSQGIYAALTNPTELAYFRGGISCHYPVKSLKNVVYRDAEAAYKAFKTHDLDRNEVVMERIIKQKFLQHPELFGEVVSLGGVRFLEKCNHVIGVKGSNWEGMGTESRFIRCLAHGFRLAESSRG